MVKKATPLLSRLASLVQQMLWQLWLGFTLTLRCLDGSYRAMDKIFPLVFLLESVVCLSPESRTLDFG